MAIIEYLQYGKLLKDRKDVKKLLRKVSKFVINNGILYRRSISMLLLSCLGLAKAKYTIRKIHEGVYGNHSGAKYLSLKACK